MNRGIWRWAGLVAGVAALLAAAELGLRVRYRLRVLPQTSEPGTVAVVALGDSIAAGSPGPASDAWPALLAALLRAGHPEVAWRVVNAGVPGNTAPLGYARFDSDVAAADPRLVLIAFGLNDSNPARHGLDRRLEESVPRGMNRSYLWRTLRVRGVRLARSAAAVLLAPRLTGSFDPGAQPQVELEPLLQVRTSPAGYAATLWALVSRTRDIGARPILLTMTPLASTQAPDVQARAATHEEYNRLIRECAACGAVPIVELSSSAPTGAFEADGVHLSVTGQVWVAQQVYGQLQSAGIWAELAREAGK